ncbi:4865_t:CDS:2 [Funneliformis geosporum]|uniref:11157_t:CDS:1 n=1 Tax=Funneliformis geosporum TaxID=1117311 RepID=A0A9W4WR62_9GLOM|nr:4865_t:CDS:2 [Funneliformis geosporum]CAI2172803.1 11157_t:CDS:2 [Funneliformis geosporum]
MSELPTYSQNWTSTQRFDIAALCVYLVNDSSWSNNHAEEDWKRRFLASIFRHFAINEKVEQHVLLKMPDDAGNIPLAIDLLSSSFKQQLNDEKQKDIREEIISDTLLICLGLSPSNLESVEKKLKTSNHNSGENLNLKEKLDSAISSAISNDSSSDTSLPPPIMPAEYDSRARAILFKLAFYLDISPPAVKSLEKAFAQNLYFLQQQQLEAEKNNSQDDHEMQGLRNSATENLSKHEKRKKAWRWMATGVGVVVGATAIGLTGGIAAPLVAAGISAITGASIIVTAASSVVLMTSLFGIAGGYKMHKRTRGLKEFAFTRITQDDSIPLIPSLHVNIVISGYLTEENEETNTPWISVYQNSLNFGDTFELSFDTEILRSLGRAFRRFLAESAVKVAANSALQQTVFATLASALLLPAALMKAGDMIDNPWALGADRAQKAGLILADVLIERVQGKRPTVLVGYSLGALVIWQCLLELAKNQQYGLIDTVVLIGAPITSTQSSKWKDALSVVNRRFVNAYATNDIVLGLIYRMHSLDLNIAGLHAVNFNRVENYDVTKFTSGHLGYRDPETLTKILKEIGLD